ncbi:hypothetical protein OIU79_027011 [Salix purpurea]|uniref:Uncharacterized protein n=1 Tax=Salix purpurea TaxID=77065 RepID=A0A9Q1A140_SALPP|nr:hypothetical protein OIU79_027011 [Salix purpurea]
MRQMIEKPEHSRGITVFKIEFNLFKKIFIKTVLVSFLNISSRCISLSTETSSLFSLGSYFPFRSWYR